jgi:hypothetical protein
MRCSWSEYAIHNRLTPFISMQNYHNAMYREVRAEFAGTEQQLTRRKSVR